MSDQLTQILAIDAGHTRIKFGLFRIGPHRLPESQFTGSIMNDEDFPWEKLQQWFESTTPTRAVLTGSNQSQIQALVSIWPKEFSEPVVLTKKSMIAIRSLVDEPEKVGADRLLNAVAVNAMRDLNRSAVIVDSGTAMTVDAVNSNGEFAGGAILPGILMGARALHDFTTTLPHIDGREFLSRSPAAIGPNTEEALASGLFWGHLGAARELVSRIDAELGGNSQVYLTGGALQILKPYFPAAVYNVDLSLVGIAITAQQLTVSSS